MIGWLMAWWTGAIIALIALYWLFTKWIPKRWQKWIFKMVNWVAVFVVAVILSKHWLPLGPAKGFLRNFVFVALLISSLLIFFHLFQLVYARILRWCLDHKIIFLIIPTLLVLWGGLVWLGFDTFFGWLPQPVRDWKAVSSISNVFPGLGKEFMPPLDEGAFLYMPSTMPHASIGESMDALQKQDIAIKQIPEIESVVGKLGRAETPLDPAPVSMVETIINYKPEYIVDKNGKRLRFRFSAEKTELFRDQNGFPLPAPDGKPYSVSGRFERDKNKRLIPDSKGRPFRLWRVPLDPALNKDRDAWEGIK
ncbi:MAG TPA: AcrB/AcrD/AcrF family protein, partial [Deltaproteobacteria bacterium]|nr:AcrB/AcrD/AcrF family protein [Deltaproteobacteria bacterium]